MTQAAKKAEFEFADPGEPSEPRANVSLSSEQVLGKLRLLWREHRFLYRVTGLGVVLALVLAFLIPKQYQSTIRLMPPDSGSGSGIAKMLTGLSSLKTGEVGSLGSLAGSLLGAENSGDLFVGILESRTVQDRLVHGFNLKEVYHLRWSQDARKRLASNTSISANHKSGIITVTVTDGDPRRAAALGKAYVDALNGLVVELSTSGAHRERVFLEERLKAVQQDLESAEKDFSQFASKNMAIDVKEQGKAMVESAAVLQGQLIAAQSELEGFRQIYTDNNVRVRSVEARIAELKRQLKKMGGSNEEARDDPQAADESLYPSIRKLPLLGVTYADMYRRTRIQEAVFQVLTEEYELAKVQEAKEIPSVKVLDPADVPEKKSFPPRLLILVVGTIFSFALGVTWILLSARWQSLDPTHPAKAVALEVFRGAEAHLQRVSENGSRLGWAIRYTRQMHQRSNDSRPDRDIDRWHKKNEIPRSKGPR
jgi:capsule polysaccharide export protein KpsE/RkpR